MRNVHNVSKWRMNKNAKKNLQYSAAEPSSVVERVYRKEHKAIVHLKVSSGSVIPANFGSWIQDGKQHNSDSFGCGFLVLVSG